MNKNKARSWNRVQSCVNYRCYFLQNEAIIKNWVLYWRFNASKLFIYIVRRIFYYWLKYNCFFHCRVSPYSPSSWPRIRMTSILPSLPSEVRRAYPWQKRVLAPIETHPSFPLILKWIRLFSGSRRTLKRLPLVTSQSKHDICDTAPTLLVESNGLRKICLDLLFQAL